ncbi:hypothetical protein S7711_07042 [Stachybotrys chartarum IBT 7711]|uniref:DUF6603 domain-containing protein n=1 Tax=Stachybotrys chartarum (strain CBS 109288 / IBT 7711) TaxID=1280523 RepID=A0A084ASL1_STACB|nr:hypothetical protein S7711_07042 [Stachybotrys chartarum IBT 7711]
MGGGRIHVSLTLGLLSAWFDAFLDFLIKFCPFKFASDGKLAVGMRFSMDLWFVTIRINAEIGALLSILVLPMAGRVHVDFWVFGFDIDFGDRNAALRSARTSPLGLLAFTDLVLEGAVKAILKSVPKYLWGAYDPSADPALKGNAVASLLNGPKVKDSDDVPKSNLVEDMRVGVKEGVHAFFSVEDAPREQWRPREPPSKPVDRYQKVEDEWNV